MDVFDKLGEKLARAGQKTQKMAIDLRDTARTTSQINDLNKAIQNLYAQLGQQYFQMHGEEPEEGMAELCTQIKGKQEELELAQADLQRLKNIRVCPQCGYENGADANFCAQCSAKLPELPKAPEPLEAVCSSCGAKLTPGARFCTKCGAKQEGGEEL